MKKYLGAAISAIVLLVPAGLVFADNGQGDHSQPQSVKSSTMLRLGENSANFELKGQPNEDMSENEATSSDQNIKGAFGTQGEKDGLLKHTGTTTPPGILRHEDATTSDATSSSAISISTFWNWLLGLPATTTIGDIRTQIAASTTASSSVQVPVKSGFFAELFNFFHFSK